MPGNAVFLDLNSGHLFDEDFNLHLLHFILTEVYLSLRASQCPSHLGNHLTDDNHLTEQNNHLTEQCVLLIYQIRDAGRIISRTRPRF